MNTEKRLQEIERRLGIKATKDLHVVLVIDESGSMGPVREDVIGGLNTYIDSLRKDNAGEVKVTYVHFDHRFINEYVDKPLADVPKFGHDNYKPSGNTALLEAIGRTIRETQDRVGNDRVLFVVQTDGFENASSIEWSNDRIKSLIKDMEGRGNWTFVYFGANQDAWAASAQLGFSRGNTINYNHSGIGTFAAFSNLSRNTTSYRVSEASATADFFQDTDVSDESVKGEAK